jgi:hypothetical protein
MEFGCIFLDIYQAFIVVEGVFHEDGHGEESLEDLTKDHQTHEDDHKDKCKNKYLG